MLGYLKFLFLAYQTFSSCALRAFLIVLSTILLITGNTPFFADCAWGSIDGNNLI